MRAHANGLYLIEVRERSQSRLCIGARMRNLVGPGRASAFGREQPFCSHSRCSRSIRVSPAPWGGPHPDASTDGWSWRETFAKPFDTPDAAKTLGRRLQ